MITVKRVEDRDPKTQRLEAISVSVDMDVSPPELLSQTKAFDLAVQIVKAAGGSPNMFDTAWQRAESAETARQREASVPQKP